jgi:hypothetical protein
LAKPQRQVLSRAPLVPAYRPPLAGAHSFADRPNRPDPLMEFDVQKNRMRIIFIAEYADGSKEQFYVDPWALKNGDQAAFNLARDQQRIGLLKLGEIQKVYRDPAIAYFKR